MDKVESPIGRNGRVTRLPISDKEVILRCLRNAPEGIDKKQAQRLIKKYE
jgi:hypothetical protein